MNILITAAKSFRIVLGALFLFCLSCSVSKHSSKNVFETESDIIAYFVNKEASHIGPYPFHRYFEVEIYDYPFGAYLRDSTLETIPHSVVIHKITEDNPIWNQDGFIVNQMLKTHGRFYFWKIGEGKDLDIIKILEEHNLFYTSNPNIFEDRFEGLAPGIMDDSEKFIIYFFDPCNPSKYKRIVSARVVPVPRL